ncbi:MAG: hypothetical protein Q4Q53_05050, partial [Methanocorpusculum sp.]|nr:hypothetical protein [Methanocorpusculum sp.]
VLKELVKEIRAHQWFWDTELLVLAQLEGLKIEEFPVNWTQGSNTTIKFKDIKGMAADILKMRRRMKSIKKMQPR